MTRAKRRVSGVQTIKANQQQGPNQGRRRRGSLLHAIGGLVERPLGERTWFIAGLLHAICLIKGKHNLVAQSHCRRKKKKFMYSTPRSLSISDTHLLPLARCKTLFRHRSALSWVMPRRAQLSSNTNSELPCSATYSFAPRIASSQRIPEPSNPSTTGTHRKPPVPAKKGD